MKLMWHEDDITLEGAIIGFLSVYEAGSIISGKYPTITAWVKKLPWLGRLAVMAGLAYWFARHMEILFRQGELVIEVE